MLYIPKIDNYLKILTDDEVKDLVVKNFGEYFKSTKEKLFSKLNEEQNLRKVVEWLYIFVTTPDEVEKYSEMMQSNCSDTCVHHCNIEIFNHFDLELKRINTKPMVKSKLKELLSELKNFKVQTILILQYKERNDHKIFHLSAKLIASDSDIEEGFKSMHQSIMMKIKSSASKDWIVIETIVKHSIKIF